MDELKKYIQQHREQIDLDEPGEHIWEKIAQQSTSIPAKKTPVVFFVTRWAAAACILLLAGVGTWYLVTGHTDPAKTNVAATTGSKETGNPITIRTEPAEEKIPASSEPVATTARKAMAHKKSEAIADAGAQLQNLENSFTQVINLQKDRVRNIPMYAESPDYFKDFKTQIRQMEKDERGIKSDIAKRGMTDELLSQLINVYQQKLNVLKQLQAEMNKTNTRWKQNRVPIDSAHTYFLKL